MNDNIRKVAVVVIAGAILVPIAWNYIMCPIVNGIGVLIINSVNKAKFNSKIKKGLKDGSIILNNGEYYEIIE